MGEEEAVVIDVNFQGQAVNLKSISEEVEAGQKRFAGVKAGGEIEAVVIIQKLNNVQEVPEPGLSNIWRRDHLEVTNPPRQRPRSVNFGFK